MSACTSSSAKPMWGSALTYGKVVVRYSDCFIPLEVGRGRVCVATVWSITTYKTDCAYNMENPVRPRLLTGFMFIHLHVHGAGRFRGRVPIHGSWPRSAPKG